MMVISYILIKRIMLKHGIKNWRNLSREIRYELIKNEFMILRNEAISRFGSQSTYIRNWLKMKGLRKIDYLNILAAQKGFKGNKEYIDWLYQQKGFKNKADKNRFYRLKKHYHRSVSDFEVRRIQLLKEKSNNIEKEMKYFILIRKDMRKKKREMNTMKITNKLKDECSPKREHDVGNLGRDELIRDPSNGIELTTSTLLGVQNIPDSKNQSNPELLEVSK